ncbi:translocation/assembly module TamB domain-containing protein [Propionispira raffinosivorans]|uniref:translocation/assembly module TamB domain-containing protein n=1 Tax=Propionispira raffinosivorans TaxID=86959 RepID=UPI00036F712A|nr:translocation/assembly module TamB domain-containing protein [Propionispira raffinosivorans]
MRHKPFIIIGIITIFVVLVGFCGYWYSKSQSFMTTAGELVSQEAVKIVGTKLKFDQIQIDSFHSMTAGGITLYDKTGAVLVTADSMKVNFDPWLMFQAAPLKGIASVTIIKPNVLLEQNADGTWNYSDIISENQQTTHDFAGKVYIEDAMVTGKIDGKTLKLTEINGELNFASQPAVSFKAAFADETGHADISGTLGGAHQAVSINGGDFDVENYTQFLPADLGITIKKGILKSVNVTLLKVKNIDDYTVNGEVELSGGSVNAMNTDIEDINALLVFNEKDLLVFSNAVIADQKLALHGKVNMDGMDSYMNLIAESEKFDPSTVLPNIPFHGDVAFTMNIAGTLADPLANGQLKIKSAEAYGYHFENATAKVKFAKNVVFIDAFEGQVFGGNVTAQGQYDSGNETYNAHLKMENIDANQLQEFIPGVSGRITADVGISGEGSDLNQALVYGSASIQNGFYLNNPFQRMDASFYKTGDQITIDSLSLILPQGEIGASGTIKGQTLDLDFYGSKVDLTLLAKLNPEINASGTADFSGHVKGSFDDPKIRLDFSAANGQLFYQPYQTLHGSAAGSLHGVFVKEFTMENNGQITHTAHGIVGFTGNRYLDLTIATQGARMEDLAALIAPGQTITGNIDNTVHLTGTLNDIEAVGSLHFYEGSYRGMLISGADGKYERKNGITTFKDFYITSPNVNLHLNGTADRDNHLDFDIRADDIHFDKLNLHMPYPVSGTAQFVGKLQGTIDSPVFNGLLQSSELSLNGQDLTDINGHIEYSNETINLTSFTFHQSGGTFALQGSTNLNTSTLQGKLTVENADLAAILAMVNLKNEWVDGKLNGTIDLGGTVDNPHVRLLGSMGSGTLKGYPLSNISLDIELENRVATIHKFYGEQGLGILRAAGTIDLDGPIDAQLSAQRIDAALLMHLMGSQLPATGALDLEAQFSGTVGNPEANVSIDIEGGGLGVATFDAMKGLFNLKNGIVNVNQLLIQKGQYKASAYGMVPLVALTSKPWEMPDPNQQMNLKISLDQADLSILPFLTTQVEWAMGPTKGGVTITGTVAHPFINGSIVIPNGAMKFKGIGKPVQNIEADFEFINDKLNVKKFSGVMGKGSYDLSGSTLITGGGLANYDFTLNLNQLDLDSAVYKGPLTGQLTLSTGERFGRQMPKIAGNIDLADCTINIPAMPNGTTELPPAILDISVNLGKRVHLYNSFLYDLMLQGQAKFAGTTVHPQTSGEISAIRGTVSYLKTSFKVHEASAYFNQVNSLLPSIHLEADTKLDRTKVYLVVDGPAEMMSVKLSSDPSMSETEILQLLTLRSNYQSHGTDNNLGKDQLANILDVGLQMSFLSEVEATLRNALSVDEFKVVRDTLSSTESNNTANREIYNVEIGKYLSDKFMLKYTTGITRNLYKIGIQYDLNNRISLTSDVNQDNNYSVGIEARIKF